VDQLVEVVVEVVVVEVEVEVGCFYIRIRP
jgi:hypothetical protein